MADLTGDRPLRLEALKLAIETVRTATKFTDSQIVNTASKYEKYLRDGTLPPVVNAEAPSEWSPEELDPHVIRGDQDGLV